MKFLCTLSVLLTALLLVSCSHPEKETMEQAEKLVQTKQYQEAFELVESSLEGKLANNKELMRERVRILVLGGIVDKAYAAYRDLTKTVSKNDSVLIDLLEDKEVQTRVNAARTLALSLDPTTRKAINSDSVPSLIKILKDPNADVRRAAVYALGKLHDPTSVPALIEALGDPSWWVRSDTASALGDIRDSRAVEPLFKEVQDSDPQVQEAVQNALSTLVRQPDVAPYIKTLSHPDPHIALMSAICLATVKNSAANSVLQKNFQSKEPSDRALALRGMRYGLDPANLSSVRAALKDPAPMVQVEAMKGINDYRDKESLPTIQAMSQDTKLDPKLRGMCTELVSRLQSVP